MSLPSQSDMTATPSKMSDDSQSHEKMSPMTFMSELIESNTSLIPLNVLMLLNIVFSLVVLLFVIRVLYQVDRLLSTLYDIFFKKIIKSLKDAKQKLLNHQPRPSQIRSLPSAISLSMIALSALLNLVSIVLSFVVVVVCYASIILCISAFVNPIRQLFGKEYKSFSKVVVSR